MRPIKFRAWHKIEKFMISGDDFAFEEYLPLCELFCDNTLRFMQYTGLKDNNGKEIYEGDILEYQTGYRDSVIYVEGCYWAVGSCSCDYLYSACKQNPIVIGNVYENPDLLK